ncbi:hypothetical protein GCM10010211_16550 [Streptomyces albospinus]|uniref:Uncharacterized protein n=1 Tax=Streptomyces albospinus TaxID=285515 RepID=A0ABQ2UXC4_9ACTN|nr:hypothetical protein [Streptomyces albospinus]GGU52751.1 hypothetical protein GCM10010211_16550 [Streptomyces albospinus]
MRGELRRRRIQAVISRKDTPNIKGLGKLHPQALGFALAGETPFVVEHEHAFVLLHRFKRLAVRWE